MLSVSAVRQEEEMPSGLGTLPRAGVVSPEPGISMCLWACQVWLHMCPWAHLRNGTAVFLLGHLTFLSSDLNSLGFSLLRLVAFIAPTLRPMCDPNIL